MRRLFQEFARWRLWNWSVWIAFAACAFFSLTWLTELFASGEPRPSWSLVALRLLPVLTFLPIAVFQQYLFSRVTVPALFRVLGAFAACILFIFALVVSDQVAGTSRHLLRERVTYHCLTGEPGTKCREIMRAHPEALAMFDDEEQLVIRTHSDPERRFYADLDEAHRRLIDGLYVGVLDDFANRDYGAMSEKITRILLYVDDFKDTKSYQAIARRSMARIAEERHKRALEDRRVMLMRQIAAIEDDGDRMMKQARHSRYFRRLYRSQLNTMISDIFVKDPANPHAAEWRRELAEWDRKAGRGIASARNMHRRSHQ